MSKPPAERAVEHLRTAIEALEVSLPEFEQPERGRREWRAIALGTIFADLQIALDAGSAADHATVSELARLSRRFGGLRRQLPAGAALAAGEAVAALTCGRATLEQAIGSGGR